MIEPVHCGFSSILKVRFFLGHLVWMINNYFLFIDVSLSPTPSEIARLPTGSDTGELRIIKWLVYWLTIMFMFRCYDYYYFWRCLSYLIPKTVDIHTMLTRCFSVSLFRKRKQFRRFAGCPTKLLYQVQNLILSLSLPCWCWSYRCSVKCATLFVSLCCWPCYGRQFSEW